MSSEELAQEIRSYLPGTEDVIVQYLAVKRQRQVEINKIIER